MAISVAPAIRSCKRRHRRPSNPSGSQVQQPPFKRSLHQQQRRQIHQRTNHRHDAVTTTTRRSRRRPGKPPWTMAKTTTTTTTNAALMTNANLIPGLHVSRPYGSWSQVPSTSSFWSDGNFPGFDGSCYGRVSEKLHASPSWSRQQKA